MKVFLDFYADWCPPCKAMTPTIEELEKENPSVTFKKIDIEKEQELSQQYKVMSIPTYVIEEDGKEVSRYNGVTAKSTLQKAIE